MLVTQFFFLTDPKTVLSYKELDDDPHQRYQASHLATEIKIDKIHQQPLGMDPTHSSWFDPDLRLTI